MNDLTGFQRDLLYVIASFDNPSGQMVGSEIEEYYESEFDVPGSGLFAARVEEHRRQR